MDSLLNYDFDLPDDLIATTALADRNASRLMVLRNHDALPVHDHFANLDNYLRDDDVLVVNNTKVMKARIDAYKATGGRVELLLVRPLAHGRWATLINGKGPHLPGSILRLGSPDGEHHIVIEQKNSDEAGLYEINCTTDLNTYIDDNGELPLPPYFRRRANDSDAVSYQTVYAKIKGAVAAPTAGLHFTDTHLDRLRARGITVVEVTLHVGPGTFLPIRCDNLDEHKMHSEFFSLSEDVAHILNRARTKGQRIIPVGTTSMRVLEHVMQQAHARGHHQFFACNEATSIFIRPGYRFLASSALITNFHLPKSTLLLLVSAVAGRERILRAYQEAIAQRYRFFSYGDASFLEIQP